VKRNEWRKKSNEKTSSKIGKKNRREGETPTHPKKYSPPLAPQPFTISPATTT
jgi:hypothetical protein